MMNKSKVSKVFRKQKKMAVSALGEQYENTDMCYAYYNADDMTYSDKIQFEDHLGRKRRATVNMNKVQAPVDSVVGFMAQNRREAKYIARVSGSDDQQRYSRTMNALHGFHREFTNSDQLESAQDLDMIVGGYGAIDTDLSYMNGSATTMPNGEIIKKKLDANAVYWDPSARATNLLDARWVGYWEDYDLQDALSLFQGSKGDDFEQASGENNETGYVFNPYGGIYDKIKLMNTVEWTSEESEIVRVYNHQWFEYETFYTAENPLYSSESVFDAAFYKAKLEAIEEEIKQAGDFESEDQFNLNPISETLVFDENTKKKLLESFGDLIVPIAFKRKAYYTAVVSGDHVFTWFRSIYQQGPSIQFKTGTWNRARKIWTGMVNAMIEPVKYYNKALTEFMFAIASNSKGGVMIEEDAIEDIAQFESKWAKTDAVITVRSGTLAAGKIQEKARAMVPTGLDNAIQLFESNISSAGIDPSFLGNINNEDQSGIFFKRRIKQVISKMARYFDSITLFQKEDARKMADFIRIWVENNRGSIIRIAGPDGEQSYETITEDMLAPDYDVDIQEASQSSDEKQETAVILGSIADKLLAVGDIQTGKAFIAESLSFMQVDGDVSNRLIKVLQPQDQQQVDPMQFAQMQQQLQQLQQFVQSGEREKIKSETEKNMAQTAKLMREAQLSEAQLPKVRAETVKTLEESRRTAMEVMQGNKASSENVSVNV